MSRHHERKDRESTVEKARLSRGHVRARVSERICLTLWRCGTTMAGDGKEVERSIAFFCNACETALPTGRLELSNLLTKLLSCINTINSSLESQQTTSSVSPSPNLVIQSCQRFEELVKKLPSIQLKLISSTCTCECMESY